MHKVTAIAATLALAGVTCGLAGAMQMHPLGDSRVAFDPYPFDVRPLTLHIPYRRLERAAFDDGDAFRRAFFQAVPELLTYRVE